MSEEKSGEIPKKKLIELRDNLIYCQDIHSLACRLYDELYLKMSKREFRQLCFLKLDEMAKDLKEMKE